VSSTCLFLLRWLRVERVFDRRVETPADGVKQVFD